MAGHSEGVQINDKFCALRTEKCKPCNNEYQKNCKDPNPATWGSFVQGRKMRVDKVFEAHHLLCVASVTQFIAGKKEIAEIIQQTQWCINSEKNMLAMPLWGHTIKWYCDLTASGVLTNQDVPPPFQNI